MLNKICLKDGVGLVNIVRSDEQDEDPERHRREARRRTHLSPTSWRTSSPPLIDTGATLAFDAIGGGKLAGQILTAMEIALSSKPGAYSRYGSSVHKQVYIYGAPRHWSRPTSTGAYGLAWGVGGLLLTPFLQKIGPAEAQKLRERVAAELKTTFASHYTKTISLRDALDLGDDPRLQPQGDRREIPDQSKPLSPACDDRALSRRGRYATPAPLRKALGAIRHRADAHREGSRVWLRETRPWRSSPRRASPSRLIEIDAIGRRIRAFRNAPRNTREIFAATRSDKEFLAYEDERLTYEDTWRRACTLAHALVNDYGVKKGDRVAISMRNYPEWIIAYMAVVVHRRDVRRHERALDARRDGLRPLQRRSRSCSSPTRSASTASPPSPTRRRTSPSSASARRSRCPPAPAPGPTS